MTLFDSHAHLADASLFSELEEVLERAKKNSIQRVLNINTSVALLEKSLASFSKYPWISHAGATHPHDVEERGEEEFERFSSYARTKKIVAIGETGLDYAYMRSPKEIQKKFFRRYLELAIETKLPVVVHCRDAFADFFTLLDEVKDASLKGVVHCFTGTLEDAKQALSRGWYISFSGIVTFKKSDALREVVKQVPLDKLLIETDAPFLAPQSVRGKKNEPSYLLETAQLIAAIKQIPFEVFAETTFQNTLNFLS